MDVPSASSRAVSCAEFLENLRETNTIMTTPPQSRPGTPNSSWMPDPFYWPLLTYTEAKKIEHMLHTYKVNMSKKTDTSDIDDSEQPSASTASTSATATPTRDRRQNSNAFLYGLSECCTNVHNGACWAVILEAQVTPRSILVPIVEDCINYDIPMVCLNDLRNISASNFGAYTGCLGIKTGFLPELRQDILAISTAYKVAQLQLEFMQSRLQPENNEPEYIETEYWFDLKPIDNPHGSRNRPYENDEPQASTSGVRPNKTNRPQTVTSVSGDLAPTMTFRMVLKKTSRNTEERAYLDIDKKEIVILAD